MADTRPRAVRRDVTGKVVNAWEGAPPRLRQSQIERPFIPHPTGPRSLLARLLGRG